MEYAKRMHLAGFNLHIHVIGDRAARTAIDAIEAARAADGVSSTHDSLAHLQFVQPEDIARVRSGSPVRGLHLVVGYVQLRLRHDRGPVRAARDRQQLRQPHGAGQLLCRDTATWRARHGMPVESWSADPMPRSVPAIRNPSSILPPASCATRRGDQVLNARQALTVREALNAYTIDGARFLGRAGEFGSLEVGKSADFVILDRDILALADHGKAEDIAGTKVLETWFRGARVYRDVRDEGRHEPPGGMLELARCALLALAAACCLRPARPRRAALQAQAWTWRACRAREAVIREEMQAQKIPGVGFAVVDHGKVILAKGYGYANLEHSVPVSADTVFQSGSVGKQFTSAAVMLFVEDGRLSARRSHYALSARSARRNGPDILIRHLLTHTSGIRDYGYEASYDTRRAVTEDELVRMACAQPSSSSPASATATAIPVTCCSGQSWTGSAAATTARCCASGSSSRWA